MSRINCHVGGKGAHIGASSVQLGRDFHSGDLALLSLNFKSNIHVFPKMTNDQISPRLSCGIHDPCIYVLGYTYVQYIDHNEIHSALAHFRKPIGGRQLQGKDGCDVRGNRRQGLKKTAWCSVFTNCANLCCLFIRASP